jgi:DNA-binding FadR family transcriptional regulator
LFDKSELFGREFSHRSLTTVKCGATAFFIEAAIYNMEEEDLGKLCKLVEEMQSRTMAGLDMDEIDYEFHKLLYERCGNPLALQLFEVAWQLRMAALDLATATREIPAGSAKDHQTLLQAIRAKDVVLARELIVSHHRHVLRRFGQEVELECANSASRSAETSAMERG